MFMVRNNSVRNFGFATCLSLGLDLFPIKHSVFMFPDMTYYNLRLFSRTKTSLPFPKLETGRRGMCFDTRHVK